MDKHLHTPMDDMLLDLEKELPDIRFTYRVDNYNFLEDCLFVEYIPANPNLDAELLRVKPGETDEETEANIMAMAPLENWALELHHRKRKQCCSASAMVGREGKGRKVDCHRARRKVQMTLEQKAELDLVRDTHITDLKEFTQRRLKGGIPFAFEDGVHHVSADDKTLAFLSSLNQEKGGPGTLEYRVADNTQHLLKKSKVPELLGAILRFRDRTLKYQWAREAEIRVAATTADVMRVPLVDLDAR